MSSRKLRALGLLCLPLAVGAACGKDKNKDKGTSSTTDGTTTDAGGAGGSGGTTSTTDSTGGATTTTDAAGGTGGLAGAAGAAGDTTMECEPAPHEELNAGGRVINITPERFFGEGVAVSKEGMFYMGSMETGDIYSAGPNDEEASMFIEADDENLLISAIGMYVDDATQTLYVCSSDAGNNNSVNAGEAVAIVAFDLADDGAFIARYEWPEYDEPWDGYGPNGFCNDMTMDADGNLYATDSWYPRILTLPAGGDALEEWVVDPDTFPSDTPWHLNGIDIDQSNNMLYVVENHPGALYSVPINNNGSAGDVTELTVTRTDDVDVSDADSPYLSPDGLKVAAPNLLITAEGGNNGGDIAVVRVDGDEAEIAEVISGFDQVATFALREGSAWLVENQGDHFWGPGDNCPDADPPFRLVEVPLEVGAGAGIIETTTENFFSEGVAVDDEGNFYLGSMNLGTIEMAASDDSESSVIIEPDTDNGLVSVLGLYVDNDNDILYACSSDAGNSENAGAAPVAIVAFDLADNYALIDRYEFPVFSGTPGWDTTGYEVNGFCNDLTMDADGNLYATDSWYPRILRLAAGDDTLEEWVIDEAGDVFPADSPWHLNGIDIDESTGTIYAVENHPGAIYGIPVMNNGNAGTPVEITTQRPVYMPDGLKVIGDDLLAIAEGQTSGMAIVELDGLGNGYVRRISTGLDGIATFAMVDGSAWLVENQGDHFWGGDGQETKPFRLVETPLNQ